jgi:hypothetical protein
VQVPSINLADDDIDHALMSFVARGGGDVDRLALSRQFIGPAAAAKDELLWTHKAMMRGSAAARGRLPRAFL